MCLSYKPLQNLTNYSTLYPPISSSVILSPFHTSFLFSPLHCFYLFIHRISPASLPPARANNLQGEIWLARRRAENHSLLEKWHMHRQHFPIAQYWEKDGGADSFASSPLVFTWGFPSTDMQIGEAKLSLSVNICLSICTIWYRLPALLNACWERL